MAHSVGRGLTLYGAKNKFSLCITNGLKQNLPLKHNPIGHFHSAFAIMPKQSFKNRAWPCGLFRFWSGVLWAQVVALNSPSWSFCFCGVVLFSGGTSVIRVYVWAARVFVSWGIFVNVMIPGLPAENHACVVIRWSVLFSITVSGFSAVADWSSFYSSAYILVILKRWWGL